MEATLKDIIREGRLSGIGFFEIFDFTMAEVQEWISVQAEKHRREMKRQSVVAFYHASYVAKLISSEKKESHTIYNNFPLWDEEEVAEIRVQEYKQKLEKSNEKIRARTKGA